MKVASIIAEFNPFHNGHKVPIDAARALVGEHGAVLCVMSGNAVQRGDLAVVSKFCRAEMALRAGADLVIELPAVYALGSAEHFALGAVSLIESLGVEDNTLVFGSETAETVALEEVARALDQPQTQSAIADAMAAGVSYPVACQMVLDHSCTHAEVLRQPNNLLGIAYLRAIAQSGAGLRVHSVLRHGVAHDAAQAVGQYAAASYLRGAIYKEALEADYIPVEARGLLKEELKLGWASLEKIEAVVLTLLRHAKEPMGGYLGDSEGLSQRIMVAAKEVASLQALYERVKTKRYPMARIRRLVFAMCLGLCAADRVGAPPYIRVLAANERGRSLLRATRKTRRAEVISRAAAVWKLDARAIRMFEIECMVTDLQKLCLDAPAHRCGGSEWRKNPKI